MRIEASSLIPPDECQGGDPDDSERGEGGFLRAFIYRENTRIDDRDEKRDADCEQRAADELDRAVHAGWFERHDHPPLCTVHPCGDFV